MLIPSDENKTLMISDVSSPYAKNNQTILSSVYKYAHGEYMGVNPCQREPLMMSVLSKSFMEELTRTDFFISV